MPKSMTSFFSHSYSHQEANWMFEIKSVNHRFFDFYFKAPSFLSAYEAEFRKMIQKEVTRGKVSLNISYVKQSGSKLKANQENIKSLSLLLTELRTQLPENVHVSLGDLLKLPHMIEQTDQDTFSNKEWKKVKQEFQVALEGFLALKDREGKNLVKDIEKRNKKISSEMKMINKEKEKINQAFQTKLMDRVNKLVEQVEVDEDRLMKEVAIQLEKQDINEELVRLKSHVELLEKTVHEKEYCGKQIDFIAQELNRESNTIASKVQNTTISHRVIAIKSEIEKIREQGLNLE